MSRPGAPGASTLTLALDASTYRGTVAILAGGELLAEREAAMRGALEERLMPAVADALKAAHAGPGDLGRVVCGSGPGSFTSLRIAGSIAKGICTARSIPLTAVSSLWLLAAGARPGLAPGAYLAVLDAMRGEWFGASVAINDDGAVLAEGGWAIFSAAELEARSRDQREAIIGPAPFGDHWPHARGAALLGRHPAAADDERVASLDAWEPDYGRKAEAQVRWEAEHRRPLAAE